MMEKYPFEDRFCNTLSALYQALKDKKKVFFFPQHFLLKNIIPNDIYILPPGSVSFLAWLNCAHPWHKNLEILGAGDFSWRT